MPTIYRLNLLGQAALSAEILSRCSQCQGINPEAFFAEAESAQADEGWKQIEIHSLYTDSGNPEIIDLRPEWFDAVYQCDTVA